jgi:ATP-dependent Zn protease
VVFLIPRARKPMPNDPYAEFETALTDLLTERDGFLERRIILAAARSGLNKEDPRYREAVESAFSVLDSLDLTSL